VSAADPYLAAGGLADTIATGASGAVSQASASVYIPKGTVLVATLVTTCSLAITNSMTFADIAGTSYTRLVVKDWSTDPGFSTSQPIRTVVWSGTAAADIAPSTPNAFTLTVPSGDTSNPRWDSWEVTAIPGAALSTIASTTAVLNPTTGRPSGWQRSGAVAAVTYGADPDPSGARGAASKWHARLALVWASGQGSSPMASWTSDGSQMGPFRPNLGVAGFTLGGTGQLRFSRRGTGNAELGALLKEKTLHWERFSRGASGDTPPGSGATIDIYNTSASTLPVGTVAPPLRPYNGDFSRADASDNLLEWDRPVGDTLKRVPKSGGGYPSGWSAVTSPYIGKWTSAGIGGMLVGSVDGVAINAQDYLLVLFVACNTPGVQIQATFGSLTSAAVSNFTADADSASPVARSFTLDPIADTSPMVMTVKRTGGPTGPVTIWLKDFTIYGTSDVRPALGFHYVTVEQRYTGRSRGMVT
jgi:hypothetical protein